MSIPRVTFDEEDYDDDSEPGGGCCFHCAGDGWVECHDPIQCT